MLNLDPVPKIVTFDCYGTLTQWHKALEEALRKILVKHAGDSSSVTDAQVNEAVQRFRTFAVDLQGQSPYRDYKTVLRTTLTEVLARQGHSHDSDDAETLLSYMRDIPPHPEVPAALQRLRARYRLAIISNTDDDMIYATVKSIGVPIDFVITAQQAKAYKPDHRLFQHAYTTMGVMKEETVHVGMGQFTDLKVCHELKNRVVWIDRVGETLDKEWRPDAVLGDLEGLPGLLGV